MGWRGGKGRVLSGASMLKSARGLILRAREVRRSEKNIDARCVVWRVCLTAGRRRGSIAAVTGGCGRARRAAGKSRGERP